MMDTTVDKEAAPSDSRKQDSARNELSQWRLFQGGQLLVITGPCRRLLVQDLQANVKSADAIVRFADSTCFPETEEGGPEVERFKCADSFIKALFLLSSFVPKRPEILVVEDVGRFFPGNAAHTAGSIASALEYLYLLTLKSVLILYVTGDGFDRWDHWNRRLRARSTEVIEVKNARQFGVLEVQLERRKKMFKVSEGASGRLVLYQPPVSSGKVCSSVDSSRIPGPAGEIGRKRKHSPDPEEEKRKRLREAQDAMIWNHCLQLEPSWLQKVINSSNLSFVQKIAATHKYLKVPYLMVQLSLLERKEFNRYFSVKVRDTKCVMDAFIDDAIIADFKKFMADGTVLCLKDVTVSQNEDKTKWLYLTRRNLVKLSYKQGEEVLTEKCGEITEEEFTEIVSKAKTLLD